MAFLSGTLVLGDTLAANFDDLFADANEGTDVVVRSATDVATDDSIGGAPIDAATRRRRPRRRRRRRRRGERSGYGQLVSADGDLIGGNGPPTIAGNWIETDGPEPLRARRRARARRPTTRSSSTAARPKNGDLHLGDTIEVRVPQPVEVPSSASPRSAAPTAWARRRSRASRSTAAQQYFMGGAERISSVLVQADDGVDAATLAERIQDVVPAGVETMTGAELTDENISDINDDFLGRFRTLLVVFSAIALFVATFSINNTFSIVVAQRTHESALLRALGASRGQILGSVVAESLVVGRRGVRGRCARRPRHRRAAEGAVRGERVRRPADLRSCGRDRRRSWSALLVGIVRVTLVAGI